MKTLLLILFLMILPVSKELIYYNTGLQRSSAVIEYYERNCCPNNYETSKPRRIRGYDNQGNSINTDGQGNPSDPSNGIWEPGYEYYYESSTGYWYRTKNGGRTWEKWSSYFDLGWLAWDWYGGRSHGGNVIQYYENNPVPIKSPLCLLLFTGLYIIYKKYVWN